MTAQIDALFDEWRGEILAEIEAVQAELGEKRTALTEAELADRAEKAHQQVLRLRVDGSVGRESMATALALRLEAAVKDTTGGPVVRLRGEVAELERRIADCHDALEQLDRALAPRDAAGTEDSRAAA